MAVMVDIRQIREAQARLDGRIHRTPIHSSATLGRRTGTRFFLKAECLQKTGSFKVRGVLNKLGSLSAEERVRGVIGISAGNHAQALAWGATQEGIRCTVVMPARASQVKVAASRDYGAEIVLHGDVHEAFAEMERLRCERGLTLVHPYDDDAVIAGQGTVGLEVVEDLPDVDAVIVPVGGGALIAGIATAVKALRPRARVYGVEPEGASGVRRALDAGRVVRLEHIGTIADGLAAPSTSERALEQIRANVDDVVLVTDAEIAAAVVTVLERTKLLVEPAGAAGFAALLAEKLRLPAGATAAVIASGGNIDTSRLAELLP